MRRDCCWSNTICFLLRRLATAPRPRRSDDVQTSLGWSRPVGIGKSPTHILTDQLYPIQPGGQIIPSSPPPRIFRPSYSPVRSGPARQLFCLMSKERAKQVTTWFLLSAPEKASRSPVISSLARLKDRREPHKSSLAIITYSSAVHSAHRSWAASWLVTDSFLLLNLSIVATLAVSDWKWNSSLCSRHQFRLRCPCQNRTSISREGALADLSIVASSPFAFAKMRFLIRLS